MESTKIKTKQKKTSLVKQAVWVAILDGVVVIDQIVMFVKGQIEFTAEDYLAPVPVPILMSFLSLMVLLVLLIITIVNIIDTEKDDELSKMNRYKAGYISKYICFGVIIIMIGIIKNFEFAFAGDFMDNIRLPLAIFMFEQFVENITFIILEKCY